MNAKGPLKTLVPLSPDFVTSYKKSHRWIAPIGQNFDVRQHRKQRKLEPNRELDQSHYVSDYVRHFPKRAPSINPDQQTKPPVVSTVKYVTTFEHKLFRDPPPPIPPYRSETRASYEMKLLPKNERIVFPPNPYSRCKTQAIGRDEQPPLLPEQAGVMKNDDIYLTTSRANYIYYNATKQRGIACKDIITFYDSVGVPRGARGYGPKRDTKIEALVKTTKPIYNKKWKKIKNPFQTIPHRGFRTETMESFQPHTKSDLEPYGNLDALVPLSRKTFLSPWQNLASPAMYCTEYCHIGTGHPVNAVIETTKPVKEYKHKIRCNSLGMS